MAEVVDVLDREDLANSASRPNETVKRSIQPCSCAGEWSAATSRDRPAFVSEAEVVFAGTHDAPVRLIGRRAILTATPGSAQMGHWPTLSKLVFFDVGSGAIRWGGDWHEGVDERRFAGSLAVGGRNGTGRRGGGLTL